MKPFTVMAADPPWKHGDQLPGPGRGASKHYLGGVMSTEDIMRFPVPRLADDAWLFLWRLHTHQQEALDVAQAWGFGDPCGELVWVKTKLDGTGLRIGMGRSVRLAHEVCLIFKRGRPVVASHSVPSVIFAPRTAHSRKPDEFFRAVQELVGPGQRKVELFARRERRGWKCLGDEVPGKVAA